MRHDDYLTTLEAVQNPVHEAMRRIDDMQGSGLYRRLAIDALGLQRHDRQWHEIEQDPLLYAQCQALDPSRSKLEAWAEAAATCVIPDSLAQTFAGSAEHLHVAAMAKIPTPSEEAQAQLENLIDPYRIVREMTRKFGAELQVYAKFTAQAEFDLALARQALLGTDMQLAFERDFEQMTRAAIALNPLQQSSDMGATSLGDALTLDALQEQLDECLFGSLDAEWVREYLTFATLIGNAMGYDVDGDEATSDNKATTADVDMQDTPPPDAVWRVAWRFAVPEYELRVRLKRLASRVSTAAIGGTASLGEMILAIAYACPAYRHDLTELAHPFLQHVSLHSTPSGSCANGESESLSQDDAEAFEVLTKKLRRLLVVIEDELLH